MEEDTANTQKAKVNKKRETLLSVILVLEILIMVVLIGKFSVRENQNIMLLETPIIKGNFRDPNDFLIRRSDLVNTVTLMTGSPVNGVSSENPLRKKMIFDKGQMMWVVIEDRVKTEDELVKFASIAMGKRDFAFFKKKVLRDEILNFFYDLTSSEKAFANNWREVGVKELRASPLLPWKKKVDFAVISTFEPQHIGGLTYLIKRNPSMPIYSPPITKKTVVENIELFRRLHCLVTLPPGYTPLTSRLGAYIYPIKKGSGISNSYELDLIIDLGNKRVALLVGAGYKGPLKLVKEVEKATGKKVCYYIGGTNLPLGIENDKVYKEMRELKRISPHLEIYPNFNTSLVAYQMFKDVFKDHCFRTPLGLKIRLNN